MICEMDNKYDRDELETLILLYKNISNYFLLKNSKEHLGSSKATGPEVILFELMKYSENYPKKIRRQLHTKKKLHLVECLCFT